MRFSLLFFFSLFVLLIVFAAPAPVVAQAVLQNAFPNLTFSTPVALCAPPDQSDRLFILNQQGIIYVVPNLPLATSSKMFLNISDVVSSGGELGLLGIAFHPNYQNNGYFYIYYTIGNSDPGYPYASVLSRFKVSSTNPDSADRSSEVVLMRVNQPFSNHKAGQLAFGPVDGYLYISFGDGGSGGDPFGNGQNLTAWLGKILRINVDSAAVGLHYSFPPDNPFVNDPTPGIKKEIYAYGLRNPWRYSFDHTTHTLWVGDVGQDKYEEIDTIVSGGDYGWNIMEGLHCYNPSSGCNQTGLRLPLLEYGHVNGQCAIIGGYVYRGNSIPALNGRYIYGDYCTGSIWDFDTRFSPSSTNALLISSGKQMSAYGVDKHQELYLCSYNDGIIYKFTAIPPLVPILHQPSEGQLNLFLHQTLIWGETYNASAYHVQVATDSLFNSVVIEDSTQADTSLQIGSLEYSTRYYWRVSASNGGGSSGYSSFRDFRTIDSVAPPPPVLLSPADGATNQSSILRLRWTTVPIAESYRCRLALDSSFTNIVIDDSAMTDTFLLAGPLPGDTTYYWTVNAKNEAGSGSYAPFRLFRTSPSSMIVHFSRGWNLASVPLSVENHAASVLFTGALMPAYAYSTGSGYIVRDSLEDGPGYWIKYPDSATISIAGTPIVSDSAAVLTGWNLIGSVGMPVAVTDIQSNPPGLMTSQFFGYSKHYNIVDSIRSGQGYWVKVGGPGTLYLDASEGSSAPSNAKRTGLGSIRIVPISEQPPPMPDSAIVEGPAVIPREFSLEQNYPNPFNPTTEFRYALPYPSNVRLTIYNVLGQPIRILVDGNQNAGYQSAEWNAGSYASGTYFYRLDAVSVDDPSKHFMQVRRMVLVK